MLNTQTNQPKERLAHKQPDAGAYCPAHTPDALSLHAAGNGAGDTLPWMHAANRKNMCIVPPPPTLPRRAPQRMHATPAGLPARYCRTYLCGPAAPAAAVHMCMRMHVWIAAPTSLPACTRGPLLSALTSRAWSCNICNV
jgi:hypothetical protein